MKQQGMETSGKNSFTGEIGKLIQDDVHLFEVNKKFETIAIGEELREIPDEVVSQLSTDQKYLYQIVNMIRSGNLNQKVLKHVIGPLNHSWWLPGVSTVCRVWVSKHPFRRHSKNYNSLKVIITFIHSCKDLV